MKLEKLQNNQEKKENWAFPVLEKIYKEAQQISISLVNRNQKGKLLAPNGLESKLQNELHWKMARTPSFKKWFGDWQNNPEQSSKVVDKKTGEPLVVYHATVSEIEREGLEPPVYLEENKERHGSWTNKVLYFTSEPEIAKYFAENKQKGDDLYDDKGKIIKTPELPVHLFSSFINIKNPIIVSDHIDLMNLFLGEKKYHRIGLKDKYKKIGNLGGNVTTRIRWYNSKTRLCRFL